MTTKHRPIVFNAVALTLSAWLGIGALPAWGDEPLHVRIDQLIEADQLVPLAAPANDLEFLRRVTLDLVGRIPATAEARAFAADASPDKRAAVIDRLLASPEYARHMANVFDVALMERRPEKSVPIAEWQRYLYDSFAANKPYDQLVREILSADGVEPAARAQARFYLDREGEANLLTRDVGRIFLGMDLQCAQCHDHPLIADYYQADYQGLYAFFNRSVLFTDKEKKVFFAEKADGDVNYQSVFDASRKGTALPKLPGGENVPEPIFTKGEEYVTAPADGVRPVPKYSRRAQLSQELTAGKNRLFDRAITNRLWAHMMGRGLVDPVDLHHDGNLPSHPAVLALLAESFPAMKYDIKALLAQIARTRAYARSIDLPADVPARGPQLEPQVVAWNADRAAFAAKYENLQDAASKVGAELSTARGDATPVAEELAKARNAAAEAKKNAEAAATSLAAAQSALPGKQEAARLVAEANAKTAEAAAKLADDKELAEAAAKLKTRTDQLTEEVAALTKTVTEGPAAVNSTAEALAAADQSVAGLVTRFEPLQARVVTLTEQAKAADAQAKAESIALATLVSKIEDAQTVVALSQALRNVEASRATQAKAEAEFAPAREALAKFQSEIDLAQKVSATAQQAATTANAAADEARKEHADRKATLDALNEALAKTQVAQQKLADSAELSQAVAALKGKADELAAGVQSTETKVTEQSTASQSAAAQLAAAQKTVEAITLQKAQLAEQSQPLAAAVDAARQKVNTDLAAVDLARERVIERESVRCAVATMKHLTPEQFAWSVLQAAGVVDRERAAVEAEWAKNHPSPDEAAQAARPREIDQALNEKLKGAVQAFVGRFAAAAGQPQQTFQATVDQALFLANGGELRSWLAPAEGNLTDRVTKLADPQQAAAELYLTVFTRPPTEAEAAEMIAYLAPRAADRGAAVQELAWALFCSAEFRFNH